MKKATEKKEDPIEALKTRLAGASYNTGNGKRLGSALVHATKPKKKGK